jgi:protein-L-isoaspartate(D-aspartate) O-methyltransferase
MHNPRLRDRFIHAGGRSLVPCIRWCMRICKRSKPPPRRVLRGRATRLGYASVHTRIGDGYRGWPEAAPFDAILVTAAPPSVPMPLKQQLKIGGRLVLPVGTSDQELRVITRTAQGWAERTVIPVSFVPMTGEVQALSPSQSRDR